MVLVREVVRITDISTDTVHIDVCRPMNGDSLDGIEQWSHCWLLFLTSEHGVDMQLFSIVSRKGERGLELIPVNKKLSLPPNSRIIDIKPFHLVDNDLMH
jgi:hypothetical protein